MTVIRSFRGFVGAASLLGALMACAVGQEVPATVSSTGNVDTDSKCHVSLEGSRELSFRKLDAKRFQVSLHDGNRSYSFQLTYSCAEQPLEDAYAQAGFEQRAGGWWLTAGSGPQKADRRDTPTWTGLAATAFQNNVCRLVVGRSKAGDESFFAEFCLPEKDHRRVSRAFDRVELSIVLRSDSLETGHRR